MSSQNQKELLDPKIELELDGFTIKVIEIIGKAFKWTPEEFIKQIIKKEMAWIKQTIKNGGYDFLSDYFCSSRLKDEINKFMEGI